MSPKNQLEAITFAAHGSRLNSANIFILEFIAKLKTAKPINVGFLEMAIPTLEKAIIGHIKCDYKIIRVIPLFLVPGKHTLQDIPEIVTKVASAFPEASISIDTFIGAHPDFLTLLQILL